MLKSSGGGSGLHKRKASVDVAAKKNNNGLGALMTEPRNSVKPNLANLNLGESVFRLPQLGRTVSHSLAPAVTFGDDANEDPRLHEQMAKANFLRADENAMRAFREHGKIPAYNRNSANKSELIKGELSANLVKPSVSPLS